MIGSCALELSLYTQKALEQGISDYSKYLEAKVKQFPSEVIAELEVRDEWKTKSEEIIDQFLNYVLDLSIKERLQTT